MPERNPLLAFTLSCCNKNSEVKQNNTDKYNNNNNNSNNNRGEDELVGVNRFIVPFLACGDLSGFDSDQSYPLLNRSDDLTTTTTTKTNEKSNAYAYHSLFKNPLNLPYQEYLCSSWKIDIQVLSRNCEKK